MFYSWPQILKWQIIKGCETSSIVDLYWYPHLLITSTHLLSLVCIILMAQHQVKRLAWFYMYYSYAVSLHSKISAIKTGFDKLKIISLLMLLLLSYLFKQVWVVPQFHLMPPPVWLSCYYQGCLTFIKYCSNISSIFLAFRMCYLTKSWYFLSQIFHMEEKTDLGSW